MTSSSGSPHQRTVALIGNPNCGKTTLFNALTGSRYKVANYPGVTVEKKEGAITLPNGESVRLLDLPGTYSLQGSSVDELIVTRLLRGELPGVSKPDLVVAVVDATNLERNLYLVSELIDGGFKLLLVVNMIDVAEQSGLKVYDELLARALDLAVVTTSARSQRGLPALLEALSVALNRETTSSRTFAWIPADHPLRAVERTETTSSLQSPDAIAEVGALRYAWLRGIVERSTSQSEPGDRRGGLGKQLDSILTSKTWGIPILIAVFGAIFQAIFLWAQAPMELIGEGVEHASSWLNAHLPAGMLTDLLTQGIVPGVGNVVVFVPQIAILFLCIGLLEDSGYLSRAAFLLDNMMRRVGLQGRAFIPLLSSFACAIPGILATRTIASRSDRFATIMIAPLMSCSARLPVYSVLIGACIPQTLLWGYISLQGLVLLSMYILGVLGACVVAFVLKRTLLWKESSFFVMEIPPLRSPAFSVVVRNVYDSVVSFLKNASTIILSCSIVVWFLASYPKTEGVGDADSLQRSYAGQIGTAIEPLIKPLGFNWEIGVGIISSFPAREVFVSTLSTIYNVRESSDHHETLVQDLRTRNEQGSFSTLTAVSLMVFYVFACQCMSTLAVCRRETGSWGWVAGMFAYMTALAYLASLFTFQVGRLIL